jgi:hypothetical protein
MQLKREAIRCSAALVAVFALAILAGRPQQLHAVMLPDSCTNTGIQDEACFECEAGHGCTLLSGQVCGGAGCVTCDKSALDACTYLTYHDDGWKNRTN